MAADSRVPAPELFDLLGIMQVEQEEMKKTGVELTDALGGYRCASVTGLYGVDQAILNAIKATEQSRTGGMATMGDCVDRAHIICITGDGANLTHGSTGVRVAFFCGSTEFLNQSSNDVTDLVMYQVSAAFAPVAEACLSALPLLALHCSPDV